MTAFTSRHNIPGFQHPVDSAAFARSVDPGHPLIEPVLADSHTWSDLIDDLLRVRLYEDDYDGQGSPSPDKELVDSAITLAMLLRDDQWPPAHYAVAGVNGTVHFEWLGVDHSLDIEVVAPGRGEWCEIILGGESPPLMFVEW